MAAVDVDGVARFCLGRFWRTASPQQQQNYMTLFHQVLVNNITSKLGEYRGVHFTMGRAQQRDDNAVVSTVVERPNNPPTNVDWIVSNPAEQSEDHRRGRRGHIAAPDAAAGLRVLSQPQQREHRRADQRDAPAGGAGGLSHALVHHHSVALLDEAVAFGHADAAQHHARGEIVLPCHRDDAWQASLVVTEAQRGAGGLAREAAALRLRP